MTLPDLWREMLTLTCAPVGSAALPSGNKTPTATPRIIATMIHCVCERRRNTTDTRVVIVRAQVSASPSTSSHYH